MRIYQEKNKQRNAILLQFSLLTDLVPSLGQPNGNYVKTVRMLNNHKNYYNEQILEYYPSGAVKRLQRRGRKDDGHSGKIDNLHITVKGNRLHYVSDDAAKLHYDGAFDFNGDASNGSAYQYNANGSLVTDTGKGIMFIEYDDNGMPRRIQFADGNVTEYVYAATGRKLRTVYYTAIPGITVGSGETHQLTASEILSKDSIDYLGSLTLVNGVLGQYFFPGGYCQLNEGNVSGNIGWHYYNRDHLGNNREVVSESGTLEQVTNYYPFGAPFCERTTAGANTNATLQRYKYNGKELDLMHGLKWYDYGARMYDPILLTWNGIDPMCEDYYPISPYAYCGNNPVNRIDPDGRDWVKTQNNDYVWMDNVATVEDVPDGYTYIGKTGNDILYDLNINTYFEAQTSVGGSMGIDGDDRFGGVFSGNTYGLTGIADVSAVIDTNVKNGTLNNSMGISFKGVKFEVIFNQKGYSSNDNFSLEYRGNMRLQMNDMNVYIPLKYSRDLQVQPKGSVSLSASRFFKADELKRNILFREIGIEVGATNSTPIFIKPASFTWNLMRTPIIRRK